MRTPLFDRQALENCYVKMLDYYKSNGELGVWGCGSIEVIKGELDYFLDNFIAPALALASKQYADGLDKFAVDNKKPRKKRSPSLPLGV